MSTKEKHSAGNTNCQNCGTRLKGPYCHHCGQHDFDFHRSFGHVLLEVLESFFHFDGKVFTDTLTLLRHPGRLSQQFNSGKRASQIPPLRFYIFVSLVFFVWYAHTGRVENEINFGPVKEDAATSAAEEPRAAADTGSHKESTAPADPQAGLHSASGGEKDEQAVDLSPELKAKLRRAAEHPEETREAFLHLVPKMLMVCLPLFALATRFLFRRANLAYLQHLVISLHLHTFVYLFWMFTAGVSYLTEFLSKTVSDIVGFVALAYLVYYLFKSLRTLFGESRGRIAVKAGLLTCAYGFTLAIGFGVIGALSVAR